MATPSVIGVLVVPRKFNALATRLSDMLAPALNSASSAAAVERVL